MNFRQSRRETLNNLQDSPRRRHPRNTENASHTLSPPEREASARSVFLGNRVHIINFFCATELSSYRLFRPPLLLFRITYHYQARKWLLAPIIKLSPHATSKQEMCGSATSAATGPSSTSSLASEPKYLLFCPLTAQALNVTILFD